MNHVKFFRRRQFVLGPQFADYVGWLRTKLTTDTMITHHPDLPMTIHHGRQCKIVLLGYAIDPYNPELDDSEVLAQFDIACLSPHSISKNLEALTGRFVLLVIGSEGEWLFHDACGLRQVYYMRDSEGRVWCASQAESLAERFHLAYDPEMLRFREIPEYRRTLEDFALINDRSPYRNVKYLVANHCLDLRTGVAQRYWPSPSCIGQLSVADSIQRVRPLLENSIAAAANRYSLKMGITAGCDSRKSLAAARNVTDKICFFTHAPMLGKEADVAVPAKLLPQLGIKHHVIAGQQMTSEFADLYRRSATWARDRHGHISFTALATFGPGAVILNSNIAEYSQIEYWLPKSHLNGEGLAILKGIRHPAAIKDYQEWIDGAKTACDLAGMNVLVLFQLELRSRWVANTFSECDIAYESFNPYNNRRLFCVELSVKESYRQGFHRLDYPMDVIRGMWPEVLRAPINPGATILGATRKWVLSKIVHPWISPWFPIFQFLKYVKASRTFYRAD